MLNTVYTLFCLLLRQLDTHKPLVSGLYSGIYLCFYLGIHFYFSFCTVIFVASLSIIVVVVVFFLYFVLNVFILMHVDFVFI